MTKRGLGAGRKVIINVSCRQFHRNQRSGGGGSRGKRSLNVFNNSKDVCRSKLTDLKHRGNVPGKRRVLKEASVHVIEEIIKKKEGRTVTRMTT